MTLASLLLVGKGHRTAAGEPAPDLRMLLNLDLYGAPPSGASSNGSTTGDAAAPSSMLDQIRALSAMGYLGKAKRGAPPAVPASDENPPPSPSDAGEVPVL